MGHGCNNNDDDGAYFILLIARIADSTACGSPTITGWCICLAALQGLEVYDLASADLHLHVALI